MTPHRTAVPPRGTLALVVLPALLWASASLAVGQPSTYPGCATRTATVAWGGSVKVDLTECHTFGLGVVSRPPAYGSTAPGDGAPVDSYVYTHGGTDPAEGGTDTFVVLDDNSDTITVRVTVPARTSSLRTTPSTLPAMSAGNAFRQTLASSGGRAPYAYALAGGTLPVGLALGSDGVLSGTPTRRAPFNFSVRTKDAAGASAIQAYSGTVQAAPMSLLPSQATVARGVPFSLPLAVSGGLPPHRFQVEAGARLPDGLQVSAAGVVSGTTTVSPGRHAVTLRVSDASTGEGTHFELETFTLDVTEGGTPTVWISASPAAVAEDDATRLVFTVTRSAGLDKALAVTLASTGTARLHDAATVVLPVGASSATFVARTLPDAVHEPDEAFVLAIAPGPGYTVGEPSSATVILVNDDLP
jgi:hypothetical protein